MVLRLNVFRVAQNEDIGHELWRKSLGNREELATWTKHSVCLYKTNSLDKNETNLSTVNETLNRFRLATFLVGWIAVGAWAPEFAIFFACTKPISLRRARIRIMTF
jgi:hypothetical protein